jgi:hypothetical protein
MSRNIIIVLYWFTPLCGCCRHPMRNDHLELREIWKSLVSSFLRYNRSIFLTGLMKSKNHLARIIIEALQNMSDNHYTLAFSIIILTGAYT